MIEDVKEVGSELKAVPLGKGEVLGDKEVPVLLEWSAHLWDIAPQVAEHCIASRHCRASDWERTCPGSTEGIEAGKRCPWLVRGRGGENRGVESAGCPGKILRRTRQHQTTQ